MLCPTKMRIGPYQAVIEKSGANRGDNCLNWS